MRGSRHTSSYGVIASRHESSPSPTSTAAARWSRRAARTFAAISSARSRVAQSIRKKPASCSLVSAYGPSVRRWPSGSSRTGARRRVRQRHRRHELAGGVDLLHQRLEVLAGPSWYSWLWARPSSVSWSVGWPHGWGWSGSGSRTSWSSLRGRRSRRRGRAKSPETSEPRSVLHGAARVGHAPGGVDHHRVVGDLVRRVIPDCWCSSRSRWLSSRCSSTVRTTRPTRHAENRCTPKKLEQIDDQMGLDRPAPAQYVEYMSGLVHSRTISAGSPRSSATGWCWASVQYKVSVSEYLVGTRARDLLRGRRGAGPFRRRRSPASSRAPAVGDGQGIVSSSLFYQRRPVEPAGAAGAYLDLVQRGRCSW